MSSIQLDPAPMRPRHRMYHEIEERLDLSADKVGEVIELYEELKIPRIKIGAHAMPLDPRDKILMNQGVSELLPAAEVVAMVMSRAGMDGFQSVTPAGVLVTVTQLVPEPPPKQGEEVKVE